MQIQFPGGVETVAGSQHLVEVGGRRVLRDCGLFQGRRDESREINTRLRCPPDTLDAFSAHADQNDLLAYVQQIQPRRIALVHGEPDIRATLAQALRAAQAAPVLEPKTDETVTL